MLSEIGEDEIDRIEADLNKSFLFKKTYFLTKYLKKFRIFSKYLAELHTSNIYI